MTLGELLKENEFIKYLGRKIRKDIKIENFLKKHGEHITIEDLCKLLKVPEEIFRHVSGRKRNKNTLLKTLIKEYMKK